MYLVRQLRIKKRKSEQGFVLLMTLFAIMILIAVSYLALTIATQDIKTSGRYYCERRGFSAVDAGLTALCLDFDPNVLVPVSNVQVDPANDSVSKYSYTKPTRNSSTPSIQATRSDLTVGSGYNWVYQLYNGSVSGTGGSGCEMTVDVTLRYGPVNDDPGYR
ncbi:MAG TPA: hypothetical protein PLG94_02910 [Smithellaceae bacterium]|jgi:hypothetical protein|nr:hypothetical protein [Smithellaceae bacterium]HPL65447.1 hypothetical protein [Smithellaceae bacterium]